MKTTAILLAEDDPNLGLLLSEFLKKKGFEVTWANNGDEALDYFVKSPFDLCLLDVMMPKKDGFSLAKDIRANHLDVPIIFLTAKSMEEDTLQGFKVGADDYLTKPFHLSELAARVTALVRRKKFAGKNLIQSGEVSIDLNSKQVQVQGLGIDLTKKEFDLLLFLISNKGRVLSKSAIAEHLSGDMAEMLDNHDFVYAHMKNIKNKLKSADCPDYIKTIYGLGYKWQNE